MSEARDNAKKFGIKIWFYKWGIQFFPQDPSGKSYKFIEIVPLTGWSFEPNEIIESFANDDAFKITFKKPE